MAIYSRACSHWSPPSVCTCDGGGAITFVWLFNIIGTFDLANALRQPDAIASFGAAWYIPTFFVPLLLVTHFLIFKELLTKPIRCEAAKAV